MANVFWFGGEDTEMYSVGPNCAVTTSAGTFRSAYARCALQTLGSANSSSAGYWQNWASYATTPSTFWFTARTCQTNQTPGSAIFAFVDANNFVRLQLVQGSTILVQKVNTAGTATTLTNTIAAWTPGWSFNNDRMVIQWINAVSGTINIWVNGILRFNYTGDTTTEATAITGHRLGSAGNSQAGDWSEIIVTDQDCRTWNLQTLPPVANGNTHNFDIGTPAASNVNEIVLSYATLDGASTAGLIDQYTIGAIAPGTYTIYMVGVSAMLVKGTTGPSKMDLGLRVSATDYWSTDFTLTLDWFSYQYGWLQDPSTSATWTGLPANIGLKSVT